MLEVLSASERPLSMIARSRVDPKSPSNEVASTMTTTRRSPVNDSVSRRWMPRDRPRLKIEVAGFSVTRRNSMYSLKPASRSLRTRMRLVIENAFQPKDRAAMAQAHQATPEKYPGRVAKVIAWVAGMTRAHSDETTLIVIASGLPGSASIATLCLRNQAATFQALAAARSQAAMVDTTAYPR